MTFTQKPASGILEMGLHVTWVQA